MRHHRCTQDADGKQQALAAVEPRHEPRHHIGTRRICEKHLRAECEHDDPHETRDDCLEAAHAPRLEAENDEGRHRGEHRRGQQRNAEQQIEADGGADELGHIGGHGHQLGHAPQADDHRTPVARPAGLGQVHPRRNAELCTEGLDDHGHEDRGDDHPQEQEPELRSRRHIGGEVARIDVGHGSDEGGPEKRREPANATAAACERFFRRPQHECIAGKRLGRSRGRTIGRGTGGPRPLHPVVSHRPGW